VPECSRHKFQLDERLLRLRATRIVKFFDRLNEHAQRSEALDARISGSNTGPVRAVAELDGPSV
jgi:hypothetical protein